MKSTRKIRKIANLARYIREKPRSSSFDGSNKVKINKLRVLESRRDIHELLYGTKMGKKLLKIMGIKALSPEMEECLQSASAKSLDYEVKTKPEAIFSIFLTRCLYDFYQVLSDDIEGPIVLCVIEESSEKEKLQQKLSNIRKIMKGQEKTRENIKIRGELFLVLTFKELKEINTQTRKKLSNLRTFIYEKGNESVFNSHDIFLSSLPPNCHKLAINVSTSSNTLKKEHNNNLSAASSVTTYDSKYKIFEKGYVFCDPQQRLKFLYTFLKRNFGKKIFVYFSSPASANFHSKFFNHIETKNQLLLNEETLDKESEDLFLTFYGGNTLSSVSLENQDWVLLYDMPFNLKTVMNELKFISEKKENKTKIIFVMMPSEQPLLRFLQHSQLNLQECKFPFEKLAPVQDQFERLIEKNYFLQYASREAYKHYLRCYRDHPQKEFLNLNSLELPKVAKSFGLTVPPLINLEKLLSRHIDE